MIHIQYKNMQLMLIQINIHDSSYLLPIFHTSTEVKYFYTFNVNHKHNMFLHSTHLTISLCPHLH